MGSFLDFKPRNKNGNLIRSVNNSTTNVRNNDNLCILYNLVISLWGSEISGDHTDPSNLQPYLDRIDDKGVEYPVTRGDLQLLESNNRSTLNFSLNIWHFVSIDHLEPFFISRNISKGNVQCDMLMIDNGERQHLIHIKDKAALFRKQKNGNQKKKLQFFCPVCKIFRTDSVEKSEKHFKKCSDPCYFKEFYPPAIDNYTRAQPFGGNLLSPPSAYRSSAPILRGRKNKTNIISIFFLIFFFFI